MQGDDYVLYCHPSRQKTPKAEKLREWYHSLLDKSEQRGLVMFRSTMFDTFLPGGKDHAMMEPTSRLLPYFDGDFWPGEAEAQLIEIEKGASSTSAASPWGPPAPLRHRAHRDCRRPCPPWPAAVDCASLRGLAGACTWCTVLDGR